MRTRSLVTMICLCLSTIGCGDDSKKGPADPEPDPYLPATSIVNVLDNMKQAYVTKDRDGYARLLHDSLTFVFAPADVGGPDGIPQAWGLADERLSADHMFSGAPNRDGYCAEEITLGFIAGDPEEDPPLNPDWTKVTLSQVFLDLDTRHETSGDPLTYQVEGDRADLYLVQIDRTDLASGLPLWRIIRWEDKPIHLASPATQGSTWGQVKANWR